MKSCYRWILEPIVPNKILVAFHNLVVLDYLHGMDWEAKEVILMTMLSMSHPTQDLEEL